MRKIACIQITGELLREVLCIPQNVEVVRISHRETDDTYHLVLRGDGLPDNCRISETESAKHLTATFFRDEGSEIVSAVTWRAD